MLLNAPGSSATVLVALAVIGESPAAMSAGKVSSVPPPAMALTKPAASAAPAPTRSWAEEGEGSGAEMGGWAAGDQIERTTRTER
jgi:Tfp pilus assembly protein FimV